MRPSGLLSWLLVWGAALAVAACDGTTGREELPRPLVTTVDAGDAGDAAPDVSQSDDAVPDAEDEPEVSPQGRVREGGVQRETGSLADFPDVSSDGQPISIGDGGEGGAIVGIDAPPPPPAAVCGNHIVERGEECDDGNLIDGDGCSSWCTDRSKCDKCVKDNLENFPDQDLLWPICSHSEGNATSGEGADESRNSLCQKVYQCVLQNGCFNAAFLDPAPCYCGSGEGTGGAACLAATKKHGKCTAEIENAAESVDPKFIASHMQDPTLAVGQALTIVNNMGEACTAECFPSSKDGGSP